jgi:hypothetical protein
MNRKQIIREMISDFVRATVPPHMQPRFDALTGQLETVEKRSEREEMARFILSLPREKRKGIKPSLEKLKKKGIL